MTSILERGRAAWDALPDDARGALRADVRAVLAETTGDVRELLLGARGAAATDSLRGLLATADYLAAELALASGEPRIRLEREVLHATRAVAAAAEAGTLAHDAAQRARARGIAEAWGAALVSAAIRVGPLLLAAV